MMAANLVGFVIGTDGIQYMLEQLFSTWEGKSLSSFNYFSDMKLGLIALTMCSFGFDLALVGKRFLLSACGCLFVASQVMFEYRCVVFFISVSTLVV